MKPRVLFFPLDMRSHVLRCLQLADAIRDQCEVQIGTSDFCDVVADRGYRAISYGALSANLVLERARRLDNSWLDGRVLMPPLSSQIDIIKQQAPACIINDTSFTAHIAAEAAGVPCASIVNGLFSRYLSIERPVPRRHRAYAVSKFLPRVVNRAAERISFRLIHRGYNRIRRNLNLPTRPDHLSEFEADLNFVADTLEFAPQCRLPANFVHMGPLFHRGRGDAEGDVENVLDVIDPKKKTILVNLGGTGDPEVLNALTRAEFARFNIISVGWGPRRLFAAHIISKEFLDLDAVLPHADLVFTQGGTGNLFQSWSYGIPTICVPTFFEQEWNASRVVDLDLGTAFFSAPTYEQTVDAIDGWIVRKNDRRFRNVAASISLDHSRSVFRQHLLAFLQKQKAPGAKRQEPFVESVGSPVTT